MKNDYIRIRMTSQLKDQLRQLAESKNMTMSDLVIYLIRRETEKEKEL